MVKTVRSNADIVKPVKYATRKMVVVLLVQMDMQEHSVKMFALMTAMVKTADIRVDIADLKPLAIM